MLANCGHRPGHRMVTTVSAGASPISRACPVEAASSRPLLGVALCHGPSRSMTLATIPPVPHHRGSRTAGRGERGESVGPAGPQPGPGRARSGSAPAPRARSRRGRIGAGAGAREGRARDRRGGEVHGSRTALTDAPRPFERISTRPPGTGFGSSWLSFHRPLRCSAQQLFPRAAAAHSLRRRRRVLRGFGHPACHSETYGTRLSLDGPDRSRRDSFRRRAHSSGRSSRETRTPRSRQGQSPAPPRPKRGAMRKPSGARALLRSHSAATHA